MTARHMLRSNWMRMIRPLDMKIPFKFNADDVTFNAYMAKRATSVFAASPIVQGTISAGDEADLISYVPGDEIFGTYNANIDPSQCSVLFWITPEWNGDDGLAHFIWGNVNELSIFKSSGDTLQLRYAPSGVLLSVDISDWIAGTTYFVVVRWDSQKPLDGTNYCCISINNVHNFGRSSPFSPTADGTLRLGHHPTSAYGNTSAIIEGFTIYRRPLYDSNGHGVAGTFRADGPVDEIAAIYAAGVGADPCLVTGSWDVVFCLPTNASAGVLLTGTGNAWSHPHKSNVLNHWTLEDGLYGGGQWAVGFNGTSTSIDCGSAAALDDLPGGGNIFTVDAWFRCDTGTRTWQCIAEKRSAGTNGWIVALNNVSDVVYFGVWLATTPVHSYSVATCAIRDGKWHHVACYYNDTTKTGRIAIDGVWGAAVVGAGAYPTDAANNLMIGQDNGAGQFFPGAIGWVRLSDNDRHTAGTNFIPPREPPGTDVNRIEQWNLADGTGVTATAEETSPGNDGTITAGTWEQQWDDVLTPVYPTSLQFDGAATTVNCGSGATLDDLPAGANGFTAELWFCGTTNAISMFLSKRWSWYITTLPGEIRAHLDYDGTDITVSFGPTPLDDTWHHLAMTYDESGDRKVRLWLDGLLRITSDASVGNYVTDAAGVFRICDGSWTGAYQLAAVSWVRLSDIRRYTANFVPPDRVNPPSSDVNTVEQWNLQDGAGLTAVAQVTSPGNDGAITMGNGRWWNTPDAENEGPGSRIFQWGYDIGSDAVNDGIHQHLAGLAAGENYVARIPARYEADKRCQPSIVAYDETNGAAISTFLGPWLTGQHDGGDNQSDLSDSSAPYWPYSLVDGVIWNITKGESATITAAGNSIVGTLSGSADWDDNDVYFIIPVDGWVWAEPFCFELPTIDRNGAAADCVHISFRLLNSAGEGVIYWQQVELLENLVDNPSLETGAAADPWIPDGWANLNLAAGETAQDNADYHSGAGSVIFVNCTINHRFFQNFTAVAGAFYSVGYWSTVADGRSAFARLAADMVHQATLATALDINLVTDGWMPAYGVARSIDATWPLYLVAQVGGDDFNVDDPYVIVLNDVALTVTPASKVDSAETSGLRVDGTDTCTQTQYNGKALSKILGRSKWEIEFDITPRHDAADVTKFGTSSPDIAWFFGDADDYIFVDYSAASILRLAFQANGGGEQSGTWNPATINAGTTYTIKIKGVANDRMELYVDGVLRITVSQPCVWGTAPATAYWGYHYAGGLSYDATFKRP